MSTSVADICYTSKVHSICSVSSRLISKPYWTETMRAPQPCEAHLEGASDHTPPRLELADILRRFAPSYAQAHAVSPFEQRIINDLIACRTASLGGHSEHCTACGFERQAYNSCRNRHCPKCQTVTKMRWLEARHWAKSHHRLSMSQRAWRSGCSSGRVLTSRDVRRVATSRWSATLYRQHWAPSATAILRPPVLKEPGRTSVSTSLTQQP